MNTITISTIYLIGIIIWLFIFPLLRLFKNINHFIPIFYILYIIPVFIFILNIIQKPIDINYKDDIVSLDVNNIIIAIATFFPIIIAFGRLKQTEDNYKLFVSILILAFITSLLSSYIIWTNKSNSIIKKHVKTITYTYSITLVITASIFYISHNKQ